MLETSDTKKHLIAVTQARSAHPKHCERGRTIDQGNKKNDERVYRAKLACVIHTHKPGNNGQHS